MDNKLYPGRFITYGWWATRSRREKRTIQAVIFSCFVVIALVFSLIVSYQDYDTKKKNDLEDPDSYTAESRELVLNSYFPESWQSHHPSRNDWPIPDRERTTTENTDRIPSYDERGNHGNIQHQDVPRQEQHEVPIPESPTTTSFWWLKMSPSPPSTLPPKPPSPSAVATTMMTTTITTTTTRITTSTATTETTTPRSTSSASTPTFSPTPMVSPSKGIPSTSPLTPTSSVKQSSNEQMQPGSSIILPSEQSLINPHASNNTYNRNSTHTTTPTPTTPTPTTPTIPTVSSDAESKNNESHGKTIKLSSISSNINLTLVLNISEIANKNWDESLHITEKYPEPTTTTSEPYVNPTILSPIVESSTLTNVSSLGTNQTDNLDNITSYQPNNSLNFNTVQTTTRNMTDHTIAAASTPSATSMIPLDGGIAPLKDQCIEDECLIIAKSLNQSIDENTAPCDDFYEYICGNWEKTTISPPTTLGISGIVLTDRIKNDIKDLLLQEALQYDSKAEKNVKTLYKSCVFSERTGKQSLVFIQRTLTALTSIARNKGDNSKKTDLSRLVLELIPLYSNYLLPIGVKKDPASVTKNVLHIGVLPLQLVSKENYDVKLPYFAAFRQLLTKIAYEMQVQSIVQKVIGLELLLSEITPSDLTKDQLNYNSIPIKDLEENTQISWLKIFQSAVDLTGKNITLTEEEVVVVDSLEYLKNLIEVLKNAEEHDLIDFVLMKFIMSKIDAMPDPFYTMYQQYKQVTSGISHENRPLSCVLFVGNVVPGIISKIYSRRYFSDADKYKNIHVPKMIHAAVINMVSNIRWMDQFTKWEALKKLYSMLQMIGSDENLNSDPFIEQFQFSDSYMNNLFIINKYEVIRTFSKLREINSRGQWSMDSHPFEIKAFYTPDQNSIYIPAVMFQLPLFHDDLPLAMQFGALGSVVGHAYIHSLDLQGSQFDENGNMRNWWSNNTKRNFLRQARALNSDPIKELQLDDMLESSADIGGLKIALKAYHKMMQEFNLDPQRLPQNSFTSEQLFYVSYTHAWCDKGMMQNAMDIKHKRTNMSAKRRVILTLQNTKEFSAAFHCNAGDFMNPGKKVTIW